MMLRDIKTYILELTPVCEYILYLNCLCLFWATSFRKNIWPNQSHIMTTLILSLKSEKYTIDIDFVLSAANPFLN